MVELHLDERVQGGLMLLESSANSNTSIPSTRPFARRLPRDHGMRRGRGACTVAVFSAALRQGGESSRAAGGTQDPSFRRGRSINEIYYC